MTNNTARVGPRSTRTTHVADDGPARQVRSLHLYIENGTYGNDPLTVRTQLSD